MTTATTKRETAEDVMLALFEGRCGHRWIGLVTGSFGCPVCGDADGDHHLKTMQVLPVQVDDFGGGDWGRLDKRARAIANANGRQHTKEENEQ